MRIRIIAVVIAFSCAALVAPLRAQEPEKIIEQYVKASGGGKALSKIHTLTLEGTLTRASDSKSGTYTFKTKLPNRYYSELVLGDQTLIEAYNGKSSWHQISAGEISTILGEQASQMEAAGQYYNSHLRNAKQSKIGLALSGTVDVMGRPAVEIEATTPSGIKRRVSFDTQTHLIVRENAMIAGVDHELLYSDYRTVEGIKLPYKIRLRRGNDTYDITITQATVNGVIGERVFDFPKKLQVQLPDLKALFKEIDEHQKAIDKLKENYAGTRVEEETEYDKTGKISKREQKEYTFFYYKGDEISTLVKKDGKSLSEEEQKKENAKTKKEIENIQKREEKKQAKEEKAKDEGKQKKDGDDADVGIETFIRTSQFVNPRRERFRGQDVLVFDFEPNPEFKPHKLAEKVVHQLAGVVWVDEKAHSVARLEGYFVGDFRFVGGLVANLQKGTSFTFEQAYINNEVWLPTYMEGHIGVRVLLVKSFKVNFAMRYSDYRKFNVESISNIGAVKATADPAPNSASDTSPTAPPQF